MLTATHCSSLPKEQIAASRGNRVRTNQVHDNFKLRLELLVVDVPCDDFTDQRQIAGSQNVSDNSTNICLLLSLPKNKLHRRK